VRVPEWLVDLFARYGYTVVFVGVMLENAGLPVPGETALLAGAALAHFGRLSLGWVVLTATCGAALGDNIGFLVGRRLTPIRLGQFDRFFERYGPQTIFIARFVTGLRVFGALLAGASAVHWRVFLLYNALGAAVWSTAIAAAGYSLAYSWDTLERWIGRSGVFALAIAGVIAVVAYLRSRRHSS
jgi:membrane protein DedA with SNARE-associated domain